jgi:hypothetical protein
MDPSRYQRDLPPTRSRRRTSPLVWILGGCGCLVLGAVGAVAGLVFIVFGSMKQSWAYQEGVAAVQASPAARAALGEPIEGGWWVSGSVNVSGPSGEASIAFPVEGPEGRGQVYVEALRSAGEWRFQLLELEVSATGERIDLLAETSDPLEIVEVFLEAAGGGDLGRAHGHFSRALAEIQPYEELSSVARENLPLFQAREVRLQRGDGEAGPSFQGTLVLQGGQEVSASFAFVREEGEWRLIAYNISS